MITEDFEAVSCDEDVRAFIGKYDLKPCQVPKSAWNLGEWTGATGPEVLHLGYRWYDPSGPFNIQPDMHVVKLTITGSGGNAADFAERDRSFRVIVTDGGMLHE